MLTWIDWRIEKDRDLRWDWGSDLSKLRRGSGDEHLDLELG